MMGFNTHYLLLFVFFIINLTNKIFYLPVKLFAASIMGPLTARTNPTLLPRMDSNLSPSFTLKQLSASPGNLNTPCLFILTQE